MRVINLLMISLVALAFGGCDGGQAPISNERLIDSFEQGRTGIWVSVEAPVTGILGDETIGGNLHQRFSVAPNQEITVQIRHSVVDSQRIPLRVGETVRAQGYYQWDARGGFISRTFRDPAQPGGGGWVEFDGQRYD